MSVAEDVVQSDSTPRNDVDAILEEEFGETQEGEEEELQEIEDEELPEDEIPEDEQEATDEEEDNLVLSEISDVAKHLGVEAEEMYSVEIPMADGEQPMTISALKDEVRQHRMQQQQFMSQQQQLNAQQQQFELARNTPGAQYSQELMEVQGAIQAIEAQDKSVDWANVEDAGQAALYRQQLQEAKTEALTKRHQILTGMQQKQRQAYVEQKNYDWASILNIIPEWKDQTVFVEDRNSMSSIGAEYGLSESDLLNISDPRFNKLLYDYTKLRAGTNTANTKAKEVRKRGVRLRTHSTKRVTKVKNAAVQSKIDRARKSGTSRDQVAAIDALIS